MKLKPILVIMSFVLWTSTIAQVSEVKKVVYPESFQAKIDEIYTKTDNWEGRLDVYYNPKASKPCPVIIHIHGGGWNHGTKESQGGFNSYFKAGFAVVNVEYRLVQVAPAPAAIEDIRAALNYVKLNAKILNIDPDRIVMEGGSSGAHLALMAGLLENDRRFDRYCAGKIDMRVAAIISNFAPSDFPALLINSTLKNSLTHWLGDKVNNTEFVASVSPLTHVKITSPPVFLVHGTADNIVPYSQTVTLQAKLQKMGVYNEFISVEGGGHGGFEAKKKAEINIKLLNFLKKIAVLQ